MSLDRSLKAASALVRHRNVLKRDERIARLKEQEKWQDGRGIYNLPKVANRKMAVAKAEKEETEEGAAAPAAGAKSAAGAKPAAGAKAAAPAAGAKAAPAAKAAAPAAKKK